MEPKTVNAKSPGSKATRPRSRRPTSAKPNPRHSMFSFMVRQDSRHPKPRNPTRTTTRVHQVLPRGRKIFTPNAKTDLIRGPDKFSQRQERHRPGRIRCAPAPNQVLL